MIGSIIEVEKGLFTHVGVFIGNGRVFHNTPERGEHVSTIQEFSGGKPTSLKRSQTPIHLVWARVRECLSDPQPYSKVWNNCEHTVSKIEKGVHQSVQLRATIIICVGLLGVMFLKARA